MEMKTILKLSLVLGLLAGVTEANAAKESIDCATITLKNDSKPSNNHDAWTAIASYKKCGANTDRKVMVDPVDDPDKNPQILHAQPGSDVVITRKLGDASRNIYEGQTTYSNLESGLKITVVCDGNSEEASCAPKTLPTK